MNDSNVATTTTTTTTTTAQVDTTGTATRKKTRKTKTKKKTRKKAPLLASPAAAQDEKKTSSRILPEAVAAAGSTTTTAGAGAAEAEAAAAAAAQWGDAEDEESKRRDHMEEEVAFSTPDDDDENDENDEKCIDRLAVKVAEVAEEEERPPPWYILPSIVLSQFAGTSLWFAGNAVLEDMIYDWELPETSSLEILTSSVQLGFICGTLVFARVSLPDRFPPTIVFLTCALVGAALNGLIPLGGRMGRHFKNLGTVASMRFLTGVCLAGIYPVGMKVAADWYSKRGLGRELGFLVGALVLGSAFPFLLTQIEQPWEWLLWETSLLAAAGGIWLGSVVPNGPHRRAFRPSFSSSETAAGGTRRGIDASRLVGLFRNPEFRTAAVGYFGHMWELYAFWTWLPVVWEAYLLKLREEEEEYGDNGGVNWDAPLIVFWLFAAGAVGCVGGGFLAPRYGSAAVAFVSLAISGCCCLVSPLVYMHSPSPYLTLAFYLLWGTAVAADSPQFSTLVAAATTPPELKGTALTLVNSIGFAITIGSIQLLGVPLSEAHLYLLLAPGPILGVVCGAWHYHHRRHCHDCGRGSALSPSLSSSLSSSPASTLQGWTEGSL